MIILLWATQRFQMERLVLEGGLGKNEATHAELRVAVNEQQELLEKQQTCTQQMQRPELCGLSWSPSQASPPSWLTQDSII